ncbi:GyrI-like domain-containing protein [Planktotalea sp.]|uniref:AraC family transcriptional regulator n=1 Tax=Planktotalea sp. TaxID=2029877 RepID=UPI0035C8515D
MSDHSYDKRISRVIDYIYSNPSADLSLDCLADVAAMSRVHWHSIFSALTGESCAQIVRRVRMHRAAFWLVQTDWTVAKIARDVGYNNTQSFTHAFREVFDAKPLEIREAQAQHVLTLKRKEGDDDMYEMKIKDAPKRRLAAMAHFGPYNEGSKSYEKVAAVFTSRNLRSQARGMVGIYYDDPSTVPEAELRSHASVELAEGATVPDGLEEVTIEGGESAVLLLKGAYSGLQDAYTWLYGQWLPQSGRMPADLPSYEVYLNSPMDTAPAELLTEIYVPLQPITTG